ncbi:MAG TPA: WD40 repeat domain-containing protein, partial [Polyangia bacterium]|nr:WD40 repeat domain-containing protein [Polyangia bacterium]
MDVASRMVIGVLAPPRASIGAAAFSPAGDTIVTVASGERPVTLWRADTFTPVWTASLPGHAGQGSDGAAAFSPDGTAALVSTAAGLYLLDSASGAIRATGDIPDYVLNVAYGWNGRRIAVLHAPLTGMCLYSPHGGSVTLLDATTLAPIATPVTWA